MIGHGGLLRAFSFARPIRGSGHIKGDQRHTPSYSAINESSVIKSLVKKAVYIIYNQHMLNKQGDQRDPKQRVHISQLRMLELFRDV